MKVNSNTKISEIIKFDEKAIDAIASVNKHFTKLKNPILRKILANRVSIADAARIGNVEIKILFDKLKEIGFEIEEKPEKVHTTNNDEPKVDKLQIENISIMESVEFDVRNIIANGHDPFNQIMDQIKILPKGKTLKIVNTFEPIPLINILKKKGYLHLTTNGDSGLINTYFKKNSEEKPSEKQKPEKPEDPELFEKMTSKYQGKTEEIDVRELEMPEPMIAILKRITTINEGFALLVHHKKIPQFLFPELQEKNFFWAIKYIDTNNVKVLIYK